MVANPLLWIEFIKIVNTEILIGFIVAKHIVNRYQDAVFHCANSTFFSTTTGQMMILPFKIALFGTHRGVRYFGQDRIEVAIGVGRFTGFAFAGTFMIARALAGPRSKVFMGWKSTHIGSGFCQQSSSAAFGDAGDGVELFYRGLKRGGGEHPQTLADALDLVFEKIVLFKQLVQQKTVMIGQLPLQRNVAIRGSCPEAGAC